MGDWYQALIDVEVDEAEGPTRRDRLLEFLVERGIVDPEPSDVPHRRQGHEPGPQFTEVLAEPLTPERERSHRDLLMNVVVIHVGRAVGHTGDCRIEARCPVCTSEYSDEAWSDAVDAWYRRVEPARAICDRCQVGTPTEHIVFLPAWGFGNLILTFWNWPRLHDDFIAELRTILGRTAVYQSQRS